MALEVSSAVIDRLLLEAEQSHPDECCGLLFGASGRVDVELLRVPGGEVPGPPDASSAWRLRVRDSGPGIPPDAVQRIFDPFYTRRQGGTVRGPVRR